MAKQTGFTLIEVLIAVIVLSIALIAIVRNTSLAANQTSYLQQRTIAHWVAMDLMAQARTGLIAAPQSGSNSSGTEAMLGQNWDWQMNAASTAQDRVVKIQVNVSDSMTHTQLDSVTSYILLPPT